LVAGDAFRRAGRNAARAYGDTCRWRIERLSLVSEQLAAELSVLVDISAGGFRDRPAATAMLEAVLASDESIRSLEIYDAERRQNLTTDRGSLGAPMPAAWQRAAANQAGVWVAAPARDRDYALGVSLVDSKGGFAGYLVVAASKPSSVWGGGYHTVATAAAVSFALFSAVAALVYLVMPYARVVANEESDIEITGDEMPDDESDTAPKQARDVIARVRRRLKAALALLGAEAGGG
jgi:hypothetical protein